MTVVRPTLAPQPDAASEIGRDFLGPLVFGAARLLPGPLARLLPLPLPPRAGGFVHADDVADALVADARPPRTRPVQPRGRALLDAAALARALGTTRVPVPAFAVRTAL